MNKSLVCTFVSSNEVKVISVRKSNDSGAVKWVAMSRFSFKKVNDRVKAEDKDWWREGITFVDTTFHRENR